MSDTATTEQKTEGDQGWWEVIRQGRSWYLTVLVVVLLLLLGAVLYTMNYWPMEFLYVLF